VNSHSRSGLKPAVRLIKPLESGRQLQTNLPHLFRALGKPFDLFDCESDAVTGDTRLIRHFELDLGWSVERFDRY